MLSIQEFKASLLRPLLYEEYPSLDALADTPLTLFAAELDRPEAYLFESSGWREALGASRRLARAGAKMAGVLAADGFAAESVLHLDEGSIYTLVHDQSMAERWVEAIERNVALETGAVTVSSVIQPVRVGQVLRGLYRAPDTVVGVPGVNDYQARINRYYGVSNPATVPNADAQVTRRHFGEVTALALRQLARSRESREIFPVYDSLAFVERCECCRKRPAERLSEKQGGPICGVCQAKRDEAKTDTMEGAGLILLEANDFERTLRELHAPSAYRRTYADMDETLRAATPNRFEATVLYGSRGKLLLALPAASAMEAAVTALEAIAVHYNYRPPNGVTASVAVSESPDVFDGLYGLIQKMQANLRRETPSLNGLLLDVRVLDQPFDRFRKPYRLDEARRLVDSAGVLRSARLPEGVLADLPAQIGKGSAALYYTFERSKLPPAGQQTLIKLEQILNLNPAAGMRFYGMLSDALSLAALT